MKIKIKTETKNKTLVFIFIPLIFGMIAMLTVFADTPGDGDNEISNISEESEGPAEMTEAETTAPVSSNPAISDEDMVLWIFIALAVIAAIVAACIIITKKFSPAVRKKIN